MARPDRGVLTRYCVGKPHFWISILFESLKTISVLRAIRYLPPFGDLSDTMYKRGWLPSKVKEPRRRQMQYSDEKLTKYARLPLS